MLAESYCRCLERRWGRAKKIKETARPQLSSWAEVFWKAVRAPAAPSESRLWKAVPLISRCPASAWLGKRWWCGQAVISASEISGALHSPHLSAMHRVQHQCCQWAPTVTIAQEPMSSVQEFLDMCWDSHPEPEQPAWHISAELGQATVKTWPKYSSLP